MMKKFFILLFALLTGLCIVMLASCEENDSFDKDADRVADANHVHDFSVKKSERYFLKEDGACTSPDTYYYSCECGEKGTETFTDGNPEGHKFDLKSTDDKYLKSLGDCTKRASYYYACSACGAVGEEVFVLDYGFFECRGDDVCTGCGGTVGLNYTLMNDKGEYYSVDWDDARDKNKKEIIIPAYYKGKPVTKINACAFENYESLEKVTIPNTVTDIGLKAFANCKLLKTVVMSDKLQKIESEAFYKCESLASVELNEGLENIGYAAFAGTAIKTITVPSSVTDINSDAFADCKELTSVEIFGDIYTIKDYVFNNCTKLESVTISKGIKVIKDDAFRNASAIKEVIYKGTQNEWKNVEHEDRNWYSGATVKYQP